MAKEYWAFQKLAELNVPKTEEVIKPQLPWWASLLISLGLEVVKQLILAVASYFLTPAVRIFLEYGLDVAFGFLTDAVIGEDPFGKNNLLFTLGFSTVTLAGRYVKLAAKNKQKILTFAKALKIEKITTEKGYDASKLTKSLYADLAKAARNQDVPHKQLIDQIVKKYEKTGLWKLSGLGLEETHLHLAKHKGVFLSTYRQINKGIRVALRSVNFLDPTYTTRYFANKLALKYKTKFYRWVTNKKIKVISKVFKKYETYKTKLNRVLLPLNHTNEEGWIMGIIVRRQLNLINSVAITFIFHPDLTNRKHPITIFNQTYGTVAKILAAKSGGQYYLDNFAWGWTIGRLLRNSGKANHLGLTGINTYLPYILPLFYTARRAQTAVSKVIKYLENPAKFSKEWSDLENYKRGLLTSNLTFLPPVGKVAINIWRTGSIKPLRGYLRNKGKRIIRNTVAYTTAQPVVNHLYTNHQRNGKN